MKTSFFTLIALLAFAGNSILCRLALGEENIDAASFTAIRLLSGIVALSLLLGFSTQPSQGKPSVNWVPALMLFVYATAFSYAYLSLETGMGALILFGTVQISMIVVGLLRGERFNTLEWAGLILALAGFVYLMLPGSEAPNLIGFLLMLIAGAAWAGYTLAGKGAKDPLQETAQHFNRTLPLVVVLMVATISQANLTTLGIVLAVTSGALASGLGYAIWYAALKGLTSLQAAVVQLLVPVIATLGGVVFASEALSLRIVLASLFILGGVLAVILGKQVPPNTTR